MYNGINNIHTWFDENSLQGTYNISDAEVNLCLEVLVMI